MRKVFEPPKYVNLALGITVALVFGGVGALRWFANRDDQIADHHTRAPINFRYKLSSDEQIRFLGREAEERGDLPEAERLYRKPLRTPLENQYSKVSLVRVLAQAGRRREAWMAIRPIVEESGWVLRSDTYAWYADLASEFLGRQQAEAAARKSVPFAESSVIPYGPRLLAWNHLWADEDLLPGRAALAHIERAIKLSPRLVASHLQLAERQRFRGLAWQPSVEKAKRLAKHGTYQDWSAIADYYSSVLGREAQFALDQAFQRIPQGDARAWCSLALFLQHHVRGDEGHQKRAWSAVVRYVRPDDVKTLLILSDHYLSNDPDKALKCALEARKATKPQQTKFLLKIARFFNKTGQISDYILTLKVALPHLKGPQHDKVLYWITNPTKPMDDPQPSNDVPMHSKTFGICY